jgi:hypothetical protein
MSQGYENQGHDNDSMMVRPQHDINPFTELSITYVDYTVAITKVWYHH